MLRRRRRTTAPLTPAAPAPATPASAPAPPTLLPPPVVTLLGLAAAVVVLGGIRASQGVVGPILLAFVIAIAVHPLQAWLRRLLPGWIAVTVTIIVTYTALTAFAGALALSVLQFAGDVTTYQAEFNALLGEGEDLLLQVGVDQAQINGFLERFDLNQVFSLVVGFLSQIAGVLTNLVFVLTLLFFVLLDASSVHAKMAAIEAIRPRVAESMRAFTHGVRQYLVVTAIFGAVVATLDVVLLYALGVPLPLLWGLLAFLASFVPTIGLVVGLVPPTIIGLLDGGPSTGLYVLIGYLLINNTIDNFVKPKFVGDAVGLSITMAFLSLVVWGFVLGPLGALLAIPASLLARALLTDGSPRRAWVTVLLGDRAPEGEELDALARGADDADRPQG